MMISPTGITISFGGTDGSESRPVVAHIVGFEREGGDQVSYDMVVPAGESVEQHLESGIYNVELILPSGRIIQRNVRIDENTNESYQFFEDFAPGQSFSLQEAARKSDGQILIEAAASSGNRSAADYAQARAEADAAERRRNTTRGMKAMGFQSPAPPPPVPPATAAVFRYTGAIALDDVRLPPRADSELLQAETRMGDSGLWRVGSSGVDPQYPAAQRCWIIAHLPAGGTELASLPLPWPGVDRRGLAEADILVDPARAGASTTVAVRDARLSPLLAFLDRGQASVAAALLRELDRDQLIEETIFGKMINPLASCAAAYVGLAVQDPGAAERWDGWLANLMGRFEDIPDGAIVHARRLILRPTGEGDNEKAAHALRQACRAGIPYFSAGVLLLREMLLQLSADFPDLAKLAEGAGIAAGRVDPSQAFTVLRFAPSEGAAE